MNKYDRVLVEVLTDYCGKYGRILVLVLLGFGCTAWYSFAPIESASQGAAFAAFDGYDQFLTLIMLPLVLKGFAFWKRRMLVRMWLRCLRRIRLFASW